MSAIRAERDYVIHEDFMKVIFLVSSNYMLILFLKNILHTTVIWIMDME